MRNYAHIASFALEHPWALTEEMMTVVAGIIARHIAGVDSEPAIEAALANRKNLPQPRSGSAAVIPVYGVIAPRMNLMSDISGGTTFDSLTSMLQTAMDDKAVKTIVMDIDSPGSSAAGAPEFAAELLAARKKKPIVAQIQYMGASGAYWLASCCTEIVAAPSARMGSIGVMAAHNDLSAALEKLGIKRTYLSAGEGKVDGHEAEPLSATAKARIDATLAGIYDTFVGDVVRGRGAGMTADRVRKEWKAHVYSAQEALGLGMIDSIGTLSQTIDRVTTAPPAGAAGAAATSDEDFRFRTRTRLALLEA